MKNTMYSATPSMRLLGKQNYNILFDSQYSDGIDDILNAHRYPDGLVKDSFCLCDAFMLGYIAGKRAERERRNGSKA